MELTEKVTATLYTEAMLLADEARAYFDQFGRAARADMTPLQRVSFSCESLKVTTRLMHAIAWLLSQRAGEGMHSPLAAAARSEESVLGILPGEAQQLIRASEDLYARIQRLDRDIEKGKAGISPALQLRARLEKAF